MTIYRVFLFLLDRQMPVQRSARSSASVASYAAFRGGLTVDDGRQTNDCKAINLSKSSNISLERQAGAYPSSKEKLPYITSVLVKLVILAVLIQKVKI